MTRRIAALVGKGIASTPLAVAAMAMLMVLVLLCTFAQVDLGTHASVQRFMRSFLVWARVGNHEIPVLPGGALVGLVLIANLMASLFARLVWNPRRIGLWIVHAGLVLLFTGEFVTGAFQVDMRMTIEEGQTVNYLESPVDVELAVIDTTDSPFNEVVAIPATVLARSAVVALPHTPLSLNVRRFFPNAELRERVPSEPPSLATMGVGASSTIVERATSLRKGENQVAALVEPVVPGRSHGVWLVSDAVDSPQSFTHEGRTYQLSMRPRRSYLPYAVSLKEFTHRVYPGTDIPKDFSSLVHIFNPLGGENRDVLISMNQPLRLDGKTFYQSGFGKQDTLSILQVVENPGWLLPYVSCVLVTLGLLLHFAVSLRRRNG
jgi:hypothetical protein